MESESGLRQHICPVPACGGRRYKSKRGLALHIWEYHERRTPYACNLCGQAFSRSTGLDAHIRRVHTGERPFACTQPGCHKKYTLEKYLSAHTKTHLKIVVNSFSCADCDKSFANRARLAVHNRSHTDERPFACAQDGCGKSFRTKMHLNGHFRTHTKERPFSCTFCPYSSAVAGNLTDHIRIHTGEKPFTCLDCGTAFATKANLTKHTARIHTSNALRRRHECSVCQKTYMSSEYLKIHERTQHTDKSEVKLRCSICDEVFSDNNSFRAHQKTVHHPEQSFTCHFCEKVFKTKANSLEHLQKHIGEKPFACGERDCGKSFMKLFQLKRHEKTHQIRKERPLKSKPCGQTHPNITRGDAHKAPNVKNIKSVFHELRVALPYFTYAMI